MIDIANLTDEQKQTLERYRIACQLAIGLLEHASETGIDPYIIWLGLRLAASSWTKIHDQEEPEAESSAAFEEAVTIVVKETEKLIEKNQTKQRN